MADLAWTGVERQPGWGWGEGLGMTQVVHEVCDRQQYEADDTGSYVDERDEDPESHDRDEKDEANRESSGQLCRARRVVKLGLADQMPAKAKKP